MGKQTFLRLGVQKELELPEQVDVESASLDGVQSHLDTALSKCLYMVLLERGGWARGPPVVCSNLNHFEDFVTIYLWVSVEKVWGSLLELQSGETGIKCWLCL